MQWQESQKLKSGDMQWVYSDRQREEILTIATMGRAPFAIKPGHHLPIPKNVCSAYKSSTIINAALEYV